MVRDLLGLPTEIQLEISDELLRDEEIEAQVNHQKKAEEPIEIHHDLINWSCMCSYFCNLIAPRIFKVAKVPNDEKNDSSLNAVARGSHNIHAKELHLIGPAPGNAYSEEATFSDT